MRIPIVNPTTFLKEKTWLTSKYTSGSSLSVINSTGFSDNDIILVGEPGQERSETTDLTASPPDVFTLTIAALNFDHQKDSPVYNVAYDQAEVFRSTDGGSTYSSLGLISLTYDKRVTIYKDVNGDPAYYYKVRLKNSASGTVTSFSDPQPGSAWPRNAVGRMIRNVRRGLKDLKTKNFEDWEIMEELKNAADDVLSEIPQAYWTLKSTTRTTTASDFDYYLPKDYRAMLFLLYTYVPASGVSERYPLLYYPKSKWLSYTFDQNREDDDWLDGWTELPGDSDYPNGYFGVYPTPATNSLTMELWYFVNEPDMNSYGDLVYCPMPQAYEYYAINALTDDSSLQGKTQAKYNRALEQLKKRQRREFGPRELRRMVGINSKQLLYGRGSVGTSQAHQETHWS